MAKVNALGNVTDAGGVLGATHQRDDIEPTTDTPEVREPAEDEKPKTAKKTTAAKK